MVTIPVTLELAQKVLSVVDVGLVSGLGKPIPGHMCVEAAVCYAMGLPHGDKPTCVAPFLRHLKISLNDKDWSSPTARSKGLRRLAIMQLGTAGVLDGKLFSQRIAEITIRKIVPRALRYAISVQKIEKHKEAMEAAAQKCEELGTREAALEAKASATHAAAPADYASYVSASASASVADYASYASAAADAAVAVAVAAASASVALAVVAASAAADAAADAAASAAADDAAAAADYDNELAFFCEEIVQILVAMKMPAAEFLFLAE